MLLLKYQVGFIFLTIYLGELVICDDICGDWISNYDQKCYKVFDNLPLRTYNDAINTCNLQARRASLVIIESKAKQTFISNLLKTHKVVDNVWIGAKNTNNTFKWSDNSSLIYTNWANGYPVNATDRCVEIMTEEAIFGQWAEADCGRKNLVVCQRFLELNECEQSLRTCLDNKDNELIKPIDIKHRENLKYLLSLESSDYKIFSENNTLKALVFPKQIEVYGSEAIKSCKAINATLVEIESKAKQLIVQSFVSTILNKAQLTDDYYKFWIGLSGQQNTGKFTWMTSGHALSYTNWWYGNPIEFVNINYVTIAVNAEKLVTDEQYALWENYDNTIQFNYICEILI